MIKAADLVFLLLAVWFAYTFLITVWAFMMRDESKRYQDWYIETVKEKNIVEQKLKNITKIIEGKK